jgi:hypothetical protein
MDASSAGDSGARADFDRLLGELRPKLHRYRAEDDAQCLLVIIDARGQKGSCRTYRRRA